MKAISIKQFVIAFVCGVSLAAISAPAFAGQSVEQRHWINEAHKRNFEKAKLEQEKEKKCGECLKSQSSTDQGKK